MFSGVIEDNKKKALHKEQAMSRLNFHSQQQQQRHEMNFLGS